MEETRFVKKKNEEAIATGKSGSERRRKCVTRMWKIDRDKTRIISKDKKNCGLFGRIIQRTT